MNMKIMKNKAIASILSFLVMSCSLAPGMYLDKTRIDGVDKVYLSGSDREYIQVEQITTELISKQDSDEESQLPIELIGYVPNEYLIGEGDVLSITVWGPEELFPRTLQSRGSPLNERVVRTDGTIFFPYIGEIEASGKTREQLRSGISIELNKIFVDAQVDVTVAQYNSKKAILSGAFRNPKNIAITEVPKTLSEAISLGGSPDEAADLSNFKLIRDGVTYEIDYEFFARTSSKVHEIFIKEDDVVYIPFNDEKKVYVVGEVVRQKEIDLRKNTMILSDAISRAGGLSNQTANGSQVYIIRKADDINEARIFQINLKSPSGFVLASKFKLKPQDIVFVGPANIARWNRVISQFFPFTTFLNAVDNLQSD